MSLAERLIKEFEEDIGLRKRFAELLISEPDIRLVLINAIIADVATKRDLNELRNELREEIRELRREMHSNFKWTVGLIITVWGATIIPILLKLTGII